MPSDVYDERPRRRDERSERSSRRHDDSYERHERRDKDRTRDRRRSRTPGHRDRRRRSPSPVQRGGPLPSQADSFALTARPKDGVRTRDGEGEGEGEIKEKEKPNYYPTGILAAASNRVELSDGTNITLKYHEPPEARLPPSRDDWKLFVFKDKDVLSTVNMSPRSCWLIGREVRVVDLPAEHPSVSGQHAVVQFRYVEKRDEFGDRKGGVKPYVIDLESKAGTLLNGEAVPAGRYLEVRSGDVLRFGESTRDYVMMLDRK